MNTIVPPSEEVVSMYQRDWDIRRAKTQRWLKIMNNSVFTLTGVFVLSLAGWAGVAMLHLANVPDDGRKEAFSEATERVTIALLGTIVLSVLFDLARNGMNKVRWWASSRLGDRPRMDDHKADGYEMLEVSSYYTPAMKLIAGVNGWAFLVTRMVMQTKDGKYNMDFSFDEVGNLQKDQARMSFGSSATMDKDAQIQQDEIIRMALSKIAHQYPVLQKPPVGRYQNS